MAGLDLPDGDGIEGVGAAEGEEFVEDADVEEEEHAGGVAAVLDGEEAFGCVVGLEVAHAGGVGDGAVLVAVGAEGDAAVEEYLEVGPDVVDGGGAGAADDLAQDGQEPGGDAGDVGYVLAEGGLDQGGELAGPVGHECNFFRGDADEVGEWVDVLDEVGGEVADAYAGGEGGVLGGEAAAEDEALAGE